MVQGNDRPTIFGVPFDRVDIPEILDHVRTAIATQQFCHIVTPGPEFVMLARSNPAYRRILAQADLSLPDGTGVIMAAWWLGLPRLRRVTGNDLFHAVAEAAQRERWRIFFYGVLREGAMSRAAAATLRRYPRLQLVGAESGFRRWFRLPDAVVCWRIRRSRADVLFVGLGAPDQEVWIARNRHRLGRVRVAAGIGGTFDYVAGAVSRAPRLVRSLGLEWLWRLSVQPRRRWRRIVTAVVHFPLVVVKERFRHA